MNFCRDQLSEVIRIANNQEVIFAGGDFMQEVVL